MCSLRRHPPLRISVRTDQQQLDRPPRRSQVSSGSPGGGTCRGGARRRARRRRAGRRRQLVEGAFEGRADALGHLPLVSPTGRLPGGVLGRVAFADLGRGEALPGAAVALHEVVVVADGEPGDVGEGLCGVGGPAQWRRQQRGGPGDRRAAWRSAGPAGRRSRPGGCRSCPWKRRSTFQAVWPWRQRTRRRLPARGWGARHSLGLPTARSRWELTLSGSSMRGQSFQSRSRA